MVFRNAKSGLGAIYLAGFLFAVHLASISYLNSSFIKNFSSDKVLNILYIVGSIASIVFLLLAPYFSAKYGSKKILIYFATIKTLATLGLAYFASPAAVLPIFVLNISIDSIIYFLLDINLEKETRLENTTGRKRSAFLTIQNAAWVLSPLSLIFLTNQQSFYQVYIFSGITLLLFVILTGKFFSNIKSEPQKIRLFKTGHMSSDEKRIIGVQFILNFFYAWMVIYLPLILNTEMGFSWPEIGLLFPIMLLPFLLFEIPTGFLSDKKFGEREILALGFVIMVASTFMIPSLKTGAFWVWALVLFLTRTGASLVEASSESYFFKQVKKEDSDTISLFRMVRPVAYILAPLLAIPVLYFLSYSLSFYFLAFVTFLGLFFIPKVDTR